MKSDDDRQALEALLRDGEGMSDAEVEALIAQELNKGDEMDAGLVADIVKEAESTQKPAFDAAANWAAIEKKLHQRRHTGTPRKWTLAAAAFVVVVLATFGAIATDAGRWDYLVRIFRPLAETLGIHMNANDLGNVGKVDRSVTTTSQDADAESVSRVIWNEREAPDTVRGIAAKPSWIPEGYAFYSADVFSGSYESGLTITYRKGLTELFVQTIVYARNDALTAVNVLEKDGKEAKVAQAITITENNGIVNAIRNDNLAFHMVWGRLSREEISQVITSI